MFRNHARALILLSSLSTIASFGQMQGGPSPTAQTTTEAQRSQPPAESPKEQVASVKALQEPMVNDWANLNRYKEANATAVKPVKVVFIGDSITKQWAQDPKAFFPGKLDYIGRGIGGQTTPQMLLRFQQDVVDLRPRVVVINGGTNDIAGNTGPSTLKMIEDNLKSMAQIAQANNIKAVLTSVTPALDYPWNPGLEPAKRVVELNRWIREFCVQNGFVFADYFTPMADENYGMREGLSEDGIHPTPAGYSIMMPIAEKAIAEALSR